MHRKYSFLIAFFFIALNAVSQQILLPERIRSFGPVAVQKPVFLDSTDLKNAPFSDETLLSYFVSAPPHEKFSTALVPDTAGFFHLQKPEKGYAFQLISFFIDADRYGKAKLTVTSPHPLELWINDVKRATKTQVNDSLHLSGSVDATLNGFVNKSRIVIKMLVSSDYFVDPAVKIELKPDEKTPYPIRIFRYRYPKNYHKRYPGREAGNLFRNLASRTFRFAPLFRNITGWRKETICGSLRQQTATNCSFRTRQPHATGLDAKIGMPLLCCRQRKRKNAIHPRPVKNRN